MPFSEFPAKLLQTLTMLLPGEPKIMSQQSQLIEFLKQELAIPADAIALGLRRSASSPNLLPIILWQYGLVTTHQLDQIFDWLEASVV